MIKKLREWGIKIVLLCVFIILIAFIVKNINEVEFKINVCPKGEIKYSQKKDNGEKYNFYISNNGKEKDIKIIRKDNGVKGTICDFKENDNKIKVFSVDSYYYSNPHKRNISSFKLHKVDHHLVFASPDNKNVKAKELYALPYGMEWVNNQTFKVVIKRAKRHLNGKLKFKNGKLQFERWVRYIKDPFNLTIYEKIIEEGKGFINWVRHVVLYKVKRKFKKFKEYNLE